MAVSYVDETDKENYEIVDAIIHKMFFDTNVNVRLSATATLAKFTSLEIVNLEAQHD